MAEGLEHSLCTSGGGERAAHAPSPLSQSTLSQSTQDGLLHLLLTHLQAAPPTACPPEELLYGCSALIQAGANLGLEHVSLP